MESESVRSCTVCGYKFISNEKACPECGTLRYPDFREKTIQCPYCNNEILPDLDGGLFCNTCNKMVRPTKQTGMVKQSNPVRPKSNPGWQPDILSYSRDEVPEEVRQWSWPAFWWLGIWLLTHGMSGWGLLVIFFGAMSLIEGIGIIFILANVVLLFYFGFNGNEMAWKRGQFQDIEDFNAREGAWVRAVWILLAVSFVLGCIGGLLQGVNS